MSQLIENYSLALNLLAVEGDRPIGVERFVKNVLSEIRIKSAKIDCYTTKNIESLTDILDQGFSDRHKDLTHRRFFVGPTFIRILFEMTLLSLLTRCSDVVLSINNFGPLWGKKGQSRIIIIHDIWFVSEAYQGNKFAKIVFKFLINAQIQRSSHIITVSEFSLREIRQYFNVPASKVSVIENCLQARANSPQSRSESQQNFVLLIGSDRPNKNIESAISGFCIYQQKNPESKLRLRIVGVYSADYLRTIRETYSDHMPYICLLGYVEDFELEELYRNCVGVLFPSLYEGFGFPAFEALSNGRPVVVAESTVCAELLQDLAIIVDTKSPEVIAEGISKLVASEVRPDSSTYKQFLHRFFRCDEQANKLTSLIQQRLVGS